MIPQTAIVQIAKKIGRELNSGAEPSEDALAAGPILAEAGATPEIVGRLLDEAQRNCPSDRMIHAYAFMLEGCPRNAAGAGERRGCGCRPCDRGGAQGGR